MVDFQEKDRYDNLVKCEDNRITVKLASENRTRSIGFFNQDGHYVKGKPSTLMAHKHKFRTYDGWGVNWVVLEHMEDDKYIVLCTDQGVLRITKGEAVESKSCKLFSKQGFELQHIIPEHLFKKVS